MREFDESISVVTANMQDYVKKMNIILTDQKIFTIKNLKDYFLLNFAVHQEKHVDKVLKKLYFLSLTVWQ